MALHSAAKIKDAARWLTLMTAVGAAVRCYFLSLPMRYDEAYTFRHFVNGGLSSLFSYTAPNNHILHTLLVRVSVGILGSHPVAMRLPSLIAGLLVIPLTFYLARSLTRSSRSGFLAAGLVSVFPYLVLYDTMARGYSILVLLSLCLAVAGIRLIERPSARLCTVVSLLIAFGLLDLPTFIFPAVGILSWAVLVLMQRGHKPVWVLTRVLTPCAIMAIAFTGLLYTPTIIVSHGIHAVLANRFVKSLPWSEFLARLPSHASDTASQFARDISFVMIVGALLLLVVGLCTLVRKGQWHAAMLFPVLVGASAAVLFIKQAIPFPRTWIYFLPFTFIFVDAGFAAIPRSACRLVRSTLLLLAGCSAILLMNHDTIASYPDTGRFPEASAVVDVLSREMRPGDEVVAAVPASECVAFYMWYQDVPHEGVGRVAVASRTFFVVQPSQYALSSLTKKDVKDVWSLGDAVVYAEERADK